MGLKRDEEPMGYNNVRVRKVIMFIDLKFYEGRAQRSWDSGEGRTGDGGGCGTMKRTAQEESKAGRGPRTLFFLLGLV